MKVKCISNKGNEDRLTIGKIYNVHPDINQSDLSGKCGMKIYCIIDTDYCDYFTFNVNKFEIVEDKGK